MPFPDIYENFSGKNIFVTGTTGFVGKVVLYKILKEFPDIGTIYCLCRSKKGVSMEDRFSKMVLSSPCFFPLAEEVGTDEWTRRSNKCKPIAGDMTHHRLGLSDTDYDDLTNNVNVIIHLAATVDFQEKLNLSCEMNVLGSVRVMSLAHKCKHLDSYVHTSTCYVNWNRHGDTPVKEQLYPLAFDPEAMLKYILSLNDSQMPSETKRLLEQYHYPNTYTFTKSITEHILMKQRGNLPLVMVRPAIIGCSWREPYHGWVDALTAAGGLWLTAGLGLLHEFMGAEKSTVDVVPVDHVVNLILKVAHHTILYHPPTSLGKICGAPKIMNSSSSTIVAIDGKSVVTMGGPGDVVNPTALPAQGPFAMSGGGNGGTGSGTTLGGSHSGVSDASTKNFPRVYQSCTSSTMNPLTQIVSTKALIAYFNKLKHPKAIGPSFVNFYANKKMWTLNFYCKRVIPVDIALKVLSIPGLKNPKTTKLLQRYKKATGTVHTVNMLLEPFTSHHWYFETSNALDHLEEGCLSKKAQKAFSTDVFDINWHAYTEAYCWGMVKFIMKDDKVEQPKVPESGTEQVLKAYL